MISGTPPLSQTHSFYVWAAILVPGDLMAQGNYCQNDSQQVHVHKTLFFKALHWLQSPQCSACRLPGWTAKYLNSWWTQTHPAEAVRKYLKFLWPFVFLLHSSCFWNFFPPPAWSVHKGTTCNCGGDTHICMRLHVWLCFYFRLH